jgi:cytochrome c oxidase subunit I+III
MATVIHPRGQQYVDLLDRVWSERKGLVGWLTTTDHKRIGIMYFFTALAFFGAGGVEALLIRTQLFGPHGHVLSPAAYDEVFTMHGVTMIFLFVIPMTTGAFGNYLLPLMIGARDMAFPRLNAVSYWIFLASGIFMYIALAQGKAPNAGWFDYVPLASKTYDPSINIDYYGWGLIFNGIASTATSINFIVTIFKLRAPGMSLNRMPLFCYAFLAVSFALLFALPSLSVACLFLELDRQLGFQFYTSSHGGNPLLWQNLFWIFGHPEVYIIILPAFGIATAIIPTFTKRKMVFFPLVALSEILVAFLGFGVWVHHMFTVGYPTLTTVYFAAASLIITIPSAIQLFAWIATIMTGTPEFKTPMLFIIGFIVFFIIGGLSGVMLAAIPFDQQVHDSYFVVAHFHFVMASAALFAIFAGTYYWFPKMFGRMMNETLGRIHFVLTFIGIYGTFFPMHFLGTHGMSRRLYTPSTYPFLASVQPLDVFISLSAFMLGAAQLIFIYNFFYSALRGPKAEPNPWHANTLEWTADSPPPHGNWPEPPVVYRWPYDYSVPGAAEDYIPQTVPAAPALAAAHAGPSGDGQTGRAGDGEAGRREPRRG